MSIALHDSYRNEQQPFNQFWPGISSSDGGLKSAKAPTAVRRCRMGTHIDRHQIASPQKAAISLLFFPMVWLSGHVKKCQVFSGRHLLAIVMVLVTLFLMRGRSTWKAPPEKPDQAFPAGAGPHHATTGARPQPAYPSRTAPACTASTIISAMLPQSPTSGYWRARCPSPSAQPRARRGGKMK